MTKLRLRIVRVDMDGYNGRDYHPQPSDTGLVVIPLGMFGHWASPEELTANPLLDGGMVANSTQALDQVNHEICWTCVTPDGRTLDLMDHEVEVEESR
jgi:hypothetical protein